MKNIDLAKPVVGRAERTAVSRVMRSGYLAQGPEVLKFENEFSKLVGEQECVAVNSGTSALLVALLSLGIGKGDEVIVPSFTFAATANAVSLTGATPVFVDVDSRTFCLDPVNATKSISKRTRAILVVHLYGLPADMKSIVLIAKQHNLLVIEDAAQAHLASIDGKPVGTFGDAAAFSFYPTKNMTSGEGGMAVFKDTEAARLSKLYRNQGMEKRYENEIVGFNLRMTDIHAAIGRVQLGRLEKSTSRRQDNARYLSDQLNGYIETPFIPENFSHVFHQYTIKTDHREIFEEVLKADRIGCGVYYPTPVHKLQAFGSRLELNITSDLCKKVLSIPVHPSLKKSDLSRIVKSIKKATRRTSE
jgi:perosamine synthetase